MTGHGTAADKLAVIPEELGCAVAALKQATTVAAILAASRTAFQIIRQAARSCEDRDPDLFAAFFSAAGAATEGCESLMLAVSSPPDSAVACVRVPQGTSAKEIADWLAVLAMALAGRLTAEAAMATAAGDRAAFQNAASAAQTVHDLLTGPGHEPSPR